MLKNGKGRATAAIAILALLGVGAGAYVLSSSNEEVNTEESTVSIQVKEDDIQTIPGISKDPEYNKLQEEVNKENYEKAKEEGTSYIPTLTNTEIEEPKFEEIKEEVVVKEEPVVETPPVVVETPEIEQPLPVFEEPKIREVVKQVPIYIPQPQPQMDVNLEAIYLAELQKLNTQWEIQNKEGYSHKFEHNYIGQKVEVKDKESNGLGYSSGVQSSGQGIDGDKASNEGAAFVRAGTILPGMMLTAVNTDEPGPVLAEIVAGPEELRGARLIGEVINAPTDVTSRVQKATIVFNRLELKGAKQGFNVNIFAVDPETMNTGVASNVDNHYFLRYGVGLAAKFVEGLGAAFAETGKTLAYTDQATIVSVSGKTKDHMKRAIGGVGQKLGSEISRISDVPATIYVDSGHPIGLLFMSNF